MTGALSPAHWLIIVLVVALLFGAKRLPEAARGLGSSLRIFKAETTAMAEEKAAAARTSTDEHVPASPAPVAAAPAAPVSATGDRAA